MSSALLDRFLDPQTRLPRHKGVWAVLGALIAIQLVALWLLCNQQVHRAQARHAEQAEQQVALADCLRSVRGASLGHCRQRLAPDRAPVPVEVHVATTSGEPATLVSYAYR
jgi:hypothetical protein